MSFPSLWQQPIGFGIVVRLEIDPILKLIETLSITEILQLSQPKDFLVILHLQKQLFWLK